VNLKIRLPNRDRAQLIEQNHRADREMYERSNIEGLSPDDFRMMLLRRIALGCTPPPEAYLDIPKERL